MIDDSGAFEKAKYHERSGSWEASQVSKLQLNHAVNLLLGPRPNLSAGLQHHALNISALTTHSQACHDWGAGFVKVILAFCLPNDALAQFIHCVKWVNIVIRISPDPQHVNARTLMFVVHVVSKLKCVKHCERVISLPSLWWKQTKYWWSNENMVPTSSTNQYKSNHHDGHLFFIRYHSQTRMGNASASSGFVSGTCACSINLQCKSVCNMSEDRSIILTPQHVAQKMKERAGLCKVQMAAQSFKKCEYEFSVTATCQCLAVGGKRLTRSRQPLAQRRPILKPSNMNTGSNIQTAR